MIRPLRLPLILLTVLLLPSASCQRASEQRPQEAGMPPAYPRAHIRDARVAESAEKFKEWALVQRGGDPPKVVYERVEILPATPTALPYGIGTYQQDLRLPIILTTGPAWAALTGKEKEDRAAQTFREISRRLADLKLETLLRPTLTLQTPQGLVLAWINDLEKGSSILHGEEHGN